MDTILPTLLALLADAALPFAVGILLGTAIEVFLPRRWSERWLVGGPRSLLLATLAGALLPGCAMSAVPVARSLRARGAPLGTVAAFLLIAPLISPHTIALTAALIGGGFAVARLVLPVMFTLVFGALANAIVQTPPPAPAAEEYEPAVAGEGGCHGGCGCGHRKPSTPLGRFGRQLWANIRALAPLFVGSLAVVSIATAFIPTSRIAEYGDSPLAYLVALVAGIPLYVCDGGEVPLTRSLLALGVGPGPAFTFLLGSVGTCLATITMAFGIIGKRMTAAYVAGTLLLALLGGLIVGHWPLLQP
jgi:uncharacterized membrane protein YraQ (UPF0718 family)